MVTRETCTVPYLDIEEDTETEANHSGIRSEENNVYKKVRGEGRPPTNGAGQTLAVSNGSRPSRPFLEKRKSRRADTESEDFDLWSLPEELTSRLTSEQLRDEYAKCRRWCADNTKPCTRDQMIRWIRQMKPDEIHPPNESPIDKVRRFRDMKPNERFLIKGQTYAYWDGLLKTLKSGSEPPELAMVLAKAEAYRGR